MWIKSIKYSASRGLLRTLYDRVKGVDNQIDNIMQVHSLRPHTLEGHMAIYKRVLHHRRNTVPKWFLESLGVYTSLLNRCDYCVDHHFAGLKRLVNDNERTQVIRKALEGGVFEGVFCKKEIEALRYAAKLSLAPADLTESDIENLRQAGWEDGEILEMNQVIAYFAYANRTVLGLGVNTAGDVLGLSPGNHEDTEDWGHG